MAIISQGGLRTIVCIVFKFKFENNQEVNDVHVLGLLQLTQTKLCVHITSQIISLN